MNRTYDVIVIGAGANSINEWIKSSWAENANPSGTDEKAPNESLSRVGDAVELGR